MTSEMNLWKLRHYFWPFRHYFWKLNFSSTLMLKLMKTLFFKLPYRTPECDCQQWEYEGEVTNCCQCKRNRGGGAWHGNFLNHNPVNFCKSRAALPCCCDTQACIRHSCTISYVYCSWPFVSTTEQNPTFQIDWGGECLSSVTMVALWWAFH